MWTETKFQVVRRETSTSRPFQEVVTDLEAAAPLVREQLDALATSDMTPEELRKQVERQLGPSGFALFMKVEHAAIMSRLGRTHRSVQYAIGNPLVAKDVSDAAPKVCLYTPLRLAVLEDEDNGVTRIIFDSPESLMGSFGSDVARTIGRMLDQKITKLIEKIS
jgi:uncharacterized protein (DUF302 family)